MRTLLDLDRRFQPDLYPQVGPVALGQCGGRLDGCSFGRRVKRGAQGFALLRLSSVCFSEQGEALRSAPHVRPRRYQPVTGELWAKIRLQPVPLETSPPRHLGRTVFLLLLLTLAGCRKDEKPNAPATPESAASQPAIEGDAPECHPIVAREGDHLVVIVDLAATDRRGRKVAKASLDVDAPAAAVRVSEPVRTEEGLTLEARIPDGTKSVKIVGTSDGGAEWSIVIRTSLGG